MLTSKTYYTLYSQTSRNSTLGLRPQIMVARGWDIVGYANSELNCSGESLEEMAGVAWIEGTDGDIKPERDLDEAEMLEFSVEKLGDDGRMYIVFDADKTSEAAAFIEEAEYHGLGDKARAMVEKFN